MSSLRSFATKNLSAISPPAEQENEAGGLVRRECGIPGRCAWNKVPRFPPPHHFAWGAKERKRKPRKRPQGNVIGRMYCDSPLEGGRFYLRLLITAVSGCTSYEFLRETPEGAMCETFRESASSRGLIREEKEFYIAFPEDASRATPRAMSRLFAPVLAYCSPGGPRAMWDSFYPILKKLNQRTLLRKPSYSSTKTYAPHGHLLRHYHPPEDSASPGQNPNVRREA